MFKSRSGSQGNATTQPPQSIEAVRRRARHRLIGASVLVLLGVLGFPLLFDTQPRPIAVDIPIEIPAKNASSVSVSAGKPGAAPKRSASSAEAVSSAESLGEREELVAPDAPATRPSAAKAEATPRAPAKPVASRETDRAKALPNDKPTATTAEPAEAAERVIVQVGAFADVLRAREVRRKVEAAGLKTYTHVAETPEGRRIRVRVGPFTTRAEADRAAARIKAQGLPAAILTL